MGAKKARPVKSDRKPINPPPIPSTPYGVTITTQPAHVLSAATRPITHPYSAAEAIPSTPYGVTITTQLAHVLAARPTREMTLDCRTLWSVRFFAAKGHFCSLLLSNILVTSAFCRLTIFRSDLHSMFPAFITFVPLCGMLLKDGTCFNR